jgi:hypothetical protein
MKDTVGFYKVMFGSDEGGCQELDSCVMAIGDKNGATVVATFDFILSEKQQIKASRWAKKGTMSAGHYATWREFKKEHKYIKKEAK